MKTTFSERLIAYLALLSGLSISAVAVYYSVVGLTAIFAAAAIPIIIMGVVLEVSKLVATVWVKQNWSTAPALIKTYLVTAIVVLMLITSMGIFGFLSKAHIDQNLVSGDVLAKLNVYDEKIKVSRENIDVNRKALKQLDEAVDQVMVRSTDEKGADKAVALRRNQQKERGRLLAEIETEQKKISQINEERAPLAAQARQVEAEVGPIKYIAAFFYDSTDTVILEKAVTWVIITLIVVFDPLAVILLLAAQTSFQQFRQREELSASSSLATSNSAPVTETSREEKISQVENSTAWPTEWQQTAPKDEKFDFSQHPYLFNVPTSYHPPGIDPVPPQVYDDKVQPAEKIIEDSNTAYNTATTVQPDNGVPEIQKIVDLVKSIVEPDSQPATVVKPPVPIVKREESNVRRTKVFPRTEKTLSDYIQNEEQQDSNLWSATVGTSSTITPEEYIQKTQQLHNDQEDQVINYAAKIRVGTFVLEDVPSDLQERVKNRL